MAAIFQTVFSNAFPAEKHLVLIFSVGPMDNKSALVQAMTRCQTGNKLFSELKFMILHSDKMHAYITPDQIFQGQE